MSEPLKEIGVCRRPEHYASCGSKDGKPHFPETCSVCGSKKVKECLDYYRSSAEYECGAKYTEKPQIQNHTDVYWGVCPK